MKVFSILCQIAFYVYHLQLLMRTKFCRKPVEGWTRKVMKWVVPRPGDDSECTSCCENQNSEVVVFVLAKQETCLRCFIASSEWTRASLVHIVERSTSESVYPQHFPTICFNDVHYKALEYLPQQSPPRRPENVWANYFLSIYLNGLYIIRCKRSIDRFNDSNDFLFLKSASRSTLNSARQCFNDFRMGFLGTSSTKLPATRNTLNGASTGLKDHTLYCRNYRFASPISWIC